MQTYAWRRLVNLLGMQNTQEGYCLGAEISQGIVKFGGCLAKVCQVSVIDAFIKEESRSLYRLWAGRDVAYYSEILNPWSTCNWLVRSLLTWIVIYLSFYVFINNRN